ncbi:MAG: leucine-rich repeat protein, partial [Bacteroidaceae bacterium]
MKQKITFKLCLAMLGLLLSFSAGAQEVIIEQLKYTLYDDGTAIVVAANTSTISGEIVIPESVENNNNTYRVTTIGSGAFEECTGLTAITIPNSVTKISRYAFK